MERDPLISVVTPCYNAEQYIDEAIESVKNQSYEKREHIVIDGGSTDETVDRLAAHPQVEYVSEADDGIYDALNKGIKRADGDLIGLLNSDDVYTEGALESFVQAYRESPDVDLVTGNSTVFYDDDRDNLDVLYDFTPPATLKKGRITHRGVALNGCLLTRSLVDSIGTFDATMDVAADVEYLLRIAAERPRSVKVNDVVYRYREHDNSRTFSDNEFGPVTQTGSREMVEFLPKYLAKSDLPSPLRRYCRRKFRERSTMLVQHHLFAGDISAAMAAGVRAVSTDGGWPIWVGREALHRAVAGISRS